MSARTVAKRWRELVSFELRERIEGLEEWATRRIDQCRTEELKFWGANPCGRLDTPPQAAVEATAERRALQAVLRMLNDEAMPDPHERSKHAWDGWDKDELDAECAPWPKDEKTP
jgi:hypothetical protein